ncbi:unnamed protein product, partial [Prorocentrum cordatum]
VGGGLLLVCGSLTCTALVVKRERRKRKDATIDHAVFDVDKRSPLKEAATAARGELAAEAADNTSLPPTPREDLDRRVYDLDALAEIISRPLPNGAERGGMAGAGGPFTPTRNSLSPAGVDWAFHPATREVLRAASAHVDPEWKRPSRRSPPCRGCPPSRWPTGPTGTICGPWTWSRWSTRPAAQTRSDRRGSSSAPRGARSLSG